MLREFALVQIEAPPQVLPDFALLQIESFPEVLRSFARVLDFPFHADHLELSRSMLRVLVWPCAVFVLGHRS